MRLKYARTGHNMLILKIILAVLLGFFLILLFLLFCTSWVIIKFSEDEWTVKVKILGVPIKIYPTKEKKETKIKNKKKSDKKNIPKKAKPKFDITFTKAVKMVSKSRGIFKRLLGAIKVRDTILVVPIYYGEPDQTAIYYGRMSGVFYGGIAAMQNFIDIEFKKINVFADFNNENKEKVSFSCKIGTTPFIMLGIAFYAFKEFKDEKII